VYFGCQDGYGFCYQQFCQGKFWAFMWYWRPLWASTFVAIVEGGEKFNEVGPSSRCLCCWVFGRNQALSNKFGFTFCGLWHCFEVWYVLFLQVFGEFFHDLLIIRWILYLNIGMEHLGFDCNGQHI
jgi:hypothetical protein